jgi:hypothetical protein
MELERGGQSWIQNCSHAQPITPETAGAVPAYNGLRFSEEEPYRFVGTGTLHMSIIDSSQVTSCCDYMLLCRSHLPSDAIDAGVQGHQVGLSGHVIGVGTSMVGGPLNVDRTT